MILIPFQFLFASLFVAVSPTDGDLREIPRCRSDFEEYASPSGKFRLSVKSDSTSQRAQYGPAGYCLTQDGEDMWCSTMPYKLCPATVFDDGTVVGTAYRRSMRPITPRTPRTTFFHVVIIDPNGTIVLNEVTRQSRHPTPHPTNLPKLTSMFVDFQERRLWLDVLERPKRRTKSYGMTHRVLRVYDVDSGRKLSESGPSQLCSNADHAHHKFRICAATPVPGTELLLVRAMTYDEEYKTRDGVFAVIDSKGDLVWQDELTDDYVVPAGERRYDSCFRFRGLGKPPVFGAGDAPGSFWIRSIHDDARIKFEVIRDPAAEKWSVQKLSK